MKKIIFTIFLFVFFTSDCLANGLLDQDQDGVPDYDEINVYHTDPNNRDTDGDGYSDWVELNNGFSPHKTGTVKLEDNDYDKDGLSDRMELNFQTNLTYFDTDGDGFSDGEEIKNGYDPNQKGAIKFEKRIEIDISKQSLNNFLGGVRLNSFLVSSGKNNSTPKGHFKIMNKNPKAWSSYGLWMPWWMGLDRGRVGIHELPFWPSGYIEGEDHLGVPVSHGCIRLGKENAKYLYDWTPVGTEVFIY